jgi:cation diffusion facilitator CzcD-associated flavoprotein CzcO
MCRCSLGLTVPNDCSVNIPFRPMALYSFSFAPSYTSTKIYPSNSDYLEYLHGIVEGYGLRSKSHLNSDVKQIHYIAESVEWEVTVAHLRNGDGNPSIDERSHVQSQFSGTEIVRAKIVVSSVGVLVEPNGWPIEGPRLDAFKGEKIHFSRPKITDNLINKKVVMVGSGCSAAQIFPAFLKEGVSSLTQIMRTTPWVEPRLKEPFGKESYARYAPYVFRYLPFLGTIV